MEAPAAAATAVDPALLPGHLLERAVLTLQPPLPSLAHESSSISSLVAALLKGDLSTVLESPAGRQLILSPTSTDGAALLETFLGIASDIKLQQERQLTALVVAAAALLAFMQSNWTGPDLPQPLRDELNKSNDTRSAVIGKLEVDGETVYSEVAYPQLLHSALRILCSGHHFNRCIVCSFSFFVLTFLTFSSSSSSAVSCVVDSTSVDGSTTFAKWSFRDFTNTHT